MSEVPACQHNDRTYMCTNGCRSAPDVEGGMEGVGGGGVHPSYLNFVPLP